MATTSDILDLDKLLAPISDDVPAGIDLREDYSPASVYYSLKALRNTARTIERKNMHSEDQGVVAKPEWEKIFKQAPKLLITQTKDLELVVWLTEAAVRLHGFTGLKNCLQLLYGLVDKFWDSLYPMPDEEDDLEARLLPIMGLIGYDGPGSIIAPINVIPIVECNDNHLFTTYSYHRSQELSKLKEDRERKQLIEAGAVTTQQFEAAIKETAEDFFRSLADNLEACLGVVEQLSNLIELKCTEENYQELPVFSYIRNVLEDAKSLVTGFLEKFFKQQASLSDDESIEDLSGVNVSTELGVTGSLSNANSISREQAFANITKIAEYFRETEPHSPISYALERIVLWGNMSLPELMQDLIGDPNALQMYYKLAGISEQSDSANDDMKFNPGYQYQPGMNMPPGEGFGPGDNMGMPPGGGFSSENNMGMPPFDRDF